jgi:chromosome segregation ATPase
MLNKDFYIHLSDASRDLADTYEAYKSLMEKDEIRCRDSNANHENSEQINSQTRIKNAIKEKEKEVTEKEEKVVESKKVVEKKKEEIQTKEEKVRKLNDDLAAAQKKFEMLKKATKEKVNGSS